MNKYDSSSMMLCELFRFARERHEMACCLLFTFVNLGGKVELDVTEIFNGVFNNHWHIGAHADNDLATQRGGLGEKVEVSQRKTELDGLFHINDNLVILLFASSLACSGQNVSSSNASADRETDTLFRARNGTRVSKHLQITNNTLEFIRGHLDSALVGSIRDPKSLVVNFH